MSPLGGSCGSNCGDNGKVINESEGTEASDGDVEVKTAKLTLVEATGLLGLCYPQARRVWGHYCERDDEGLVRQLRKKDQCANEDRQNESPDFGALCTAVSGF
jgi:hypothetical protein